jgi:hypothetical protein
MEKLFAALRERHPGYDVVDVRFLVDQTQVDGSPAENLDSAFAEAILKAKRVDLATALA